MASKFSKRDSEVVQDLLCDEDLRLFLTELSNVCHVTHGSRHFKFIPRDVVCQLLENRACEELGTLMNGISKNFRKAFNAIVAEHSEFLPLLERNQTVYVPFRTKREIDRYLDCGTICSYSVSDLAKAFLECEKTILRSVYYYFEDIISLNDGSEVKMNENMKNLAGGVSKQLKSMYGFNGEKKFFKIHNAVFKLSKVEGINYVMLVRGVDIENYIESLEDLQDIDKWAVRYFVTEIRKVARESGVIFTKELNEIVDLAPEKLIIEIRSKHTDLTSFFQIYSAIFQPIHSLSNQKNLILIGYYIPCEGKINIILDQGTGSKSDFTSCGIPPREAKILHKHIKRTIFREIKCLESLYEHMLSVAVSYGKFSTSEFEAYLVNTASKSKSNFILRIGAEKFLKIHSEIFPLQPQSIGLYNLVSKSEFKNYIAEINYKARAIFSDEISKLTESVQETKTVSDLLKSSKVLKTVDSQTVEIANVKYFASEICKVARDTGVIFIDEFNEIVDWAPEKLIVEITTKYHDVNSFFQRYSAIFQAIHSLSNQKNLILIGYYIPCDEKMHEVLNNGSESNVTSCGIPPGDIRILHNHIKGNILLEMECIEHLYEHMLSVTVAYGNFSIGEFQDYLEDTARDSERNFILNIGAEEFLKIHSKFFPVQSIGLYSLVSNSGFKNYIAEIKYKARKILSDEIRKLTEPVQETKIVGNYLNFSETGWPNVEVVAIRYLAFQIHKIAGETGIIFDDELHKVINELPQKLQLEINSKYVNFNSFITEYLLIFQPICGSSIQPNSFNINTIAYCLASNERITEILSLTSCDLSKSDIHLIVLSEEVKKLHTGVLRLTKCLENIYQRMLPKTDSIFTLVQFQKYINTRASKNEKELVCNQSSEEFLKSHSIIFPVKFDGQNYYGRVSQEKFNACITELMYYVRKVFSDEVKKQNENQLSDNNQLAFNEYIYKEQNEGYVDCIANVLNNQPHPELNYLTSLQTPLGPCHREVQTDSTGLVSSIYLYHLT